MKEWGQAPRGLLGFATLPRGARSQSPFFAADRRGRADRCREHSRPGCQAGQSSGSFTLGPSLIAIGCWRSSGPRRGGFSIVTCSTAASRLGIRPGMPAAEATALAPGLQLEPYDPAADRRALEVLACWCEPFSPNIALEQDPRPECLFLDITGLEPIVGDEPALAEQLVRALAARGFMVHVGIADTPAAAWAAAHHGELLPAPLSSSFLRSCERMGLAPSKPQFRSKNMRAARCLSPFFHIPKSPRGHVGDCPAGRNSHRLGRSAGGQRACPPATVALLGELGLQRIGQVLALPRASLASRFEPELIAVDQFTGGPPKRSRLSAAAGDRGRATFGIADRSPRRAEVILDG